MTKEAILKELERIKTESDFHCGYAKLKASILEDIRIETAKSTGTKSTDLSIIKRITDHGKQNEKYGKYHEYEEYKAFTNGRYVLCSKDAFGYASNGITGYNVSQFFKSDYESDTKIEIDMIDLRTTTKVQKRKEAKPYVFTVDGVKFGVNPFYLLDCLQFCDTNILYVTKNNAPFYMKHTNSERFGLVLPVRL